MPPPLSEKCLTNRRQWRELLRAIVDRSGTRPRTKTLVEQCNLILNRVDCGHAHRFSAMTVNHYFAAVKDGDKTIRVPFGHYEANAFAQALDNLGCWSTPSAKPHKKVEKEKLVTLLGASIAPSVFC